MAFKVTPENIRNIPNTWRISDATVWLSQNDCLSFDLWHQVVGFILESPKLKDYIIINDHVIYISPGEGRMTPLKLFKQKHLLPQIHRKTFGSKLRDSRIAFDLMERRITIQQVLAL